MMQHAWKLYRRGFLANASVLSASALLGLPRLATAEPPPEIRKIRLDRIPINCFAPQYLALSGSSTNLVAERSQITARLKELTPAKP